MFKAGGLNNPNKKDPTSASASLGSSFDPFWFEEHQNPTHTVPASSLATIDEAEPTDTLWGDWYELKHTSCQTQPEFNQEKIKTLYAIANATESSSAFADKDDTLLAAIALDNDKLTAEMKLEFLKQALTLPHDNCPIELKAKLLIAAFSKTANLASADCRQLFELLKTFDSGELFTLLTYTDEKNHHSLDQLITRFHHNLNFHYFNLITNHTNNYLKKHSTATNDISTSANDVEDAKERGFLTLFLDYNYNASLKGLYQKDSQISPGFSIDTLNEILLLAQHYAANNNPHLETLLPRINRCISYFINYYDKKEINSQLIDTIDVYLTILDSLTKSHNLALVINSLKTADPFLKPLMHFIISTPTLNDIFTDSLLSLINHIFEQATTPLKEDASKAFSAENEESVKLITLKLLHLLQKKDSDGHELLHHLVHNNAKGQLDLYQSVMSSLLSTLISKECLSINELMLMIKPTDDEAVNNYYTRIVFNTLFKLLTVEVIDINKESLKFLRDNINAFQDFLLASPYNSTIAELYTLDAAERVKPLTPLVQIFMQDEEKNQLFAERYSALKPGSAPSSPKNALRSYSSSELSKKASNNSTDSLTSSTKSSNSDERVSPGSSPSSLKARFPRFPVLSAIIQVISSTSAATPKNDPETLSRSISRTSSPKENT